MHSRRAAREGIAAQNARPNGVALLPLESWTCDYCCSGDAAHVIKCSGNAAHVINGALWDNSLLAAMGPLVLYTEAKHTGLVLGQKCELLRGPGAEDSA